MMRHPLKSLAVLALLPLLVSCGGLVSIGDLGPAAALYDLRPAEDVARASKGLAIRIDEPSASLVLNTSSIARRADDIEVTYLADARWTDRLPILISRVVGESLENAGHQTVSVQEAFSFPLDYRLQLDIRNFEADYQGGGDPVAHIRMRARLISLSPLKLLDSTELTVRIQSPGGDLRSIMSSFDDAMAQVSRDLASWVVTAAKKKSGS